MFSFGHPEAVLEQFFWGPASKRNPEIKIKSDFGALLSTFICESIQFKLKQLFINARIEEIKAECNAAYYEKINFSEYFRRLLPPSFLR